VDLGVDRHLFARHRVEREPGRHFGYPLGAGGILRSGSQTSDRNTSRLMNHLPIGVQSG
jgi:hypothetical protein